MSSNFTVQRICEHCKDIFDAKTTVTRFCSRLCNKRSYKLKERNVVMKNIDLKVKNILEKPMIDKMEYHFYLAKSQNATIDDAIAEIKRINL
ncbi:hypothetical protein [Pedobacter panaciterrae]